MEISLEDADKIAKRILDLSKNNRTEYLRLRELQLNEGWSAFYKEILNK